MHLRQHPAALLLALLTTCGLYSRSAAGSDADARALSVQLFDEAAALIARGEIAKACPKFAESHRLDPQLGALIHLADCYEKNGQVASAWGSFREAEELARTRGDERAALALERAAALEPRLSYLVIEIAPEARVAGLQVLRDGLPVTEVMWGTRAAIDPGRHRIEARAAGRLAWQRSVVVPAEPDTLKVSVPVLQSDRSSRSSTKSSAGSRRIAALAVGGLGIAGVGVGGFFGLSAQSTLSDSRGQCNPREYCTERGIELRDSARNKALVATVATGVGAGALVAAAVLWFGAPKAESEGDAVAVSARRSAWSMTPARESWGVEVGHAF